jgi:hypothetical protein
LVYDDNEHAVKVLTRTHRRLVEIHNELNGLSKDHYHEMDELFAANMLLAACGLMKAMYCVKTAAARWSAKEQERLALKAKSKKRKKSAKKKKATP